MCVLRVSVRVRSGSLQATNMQRGKVHEIIDWDLTVYVYSDWHEELRMI